jgi:hypothetical protein
MRRNNCLRAVSCFNFSLFHFCHTLDDSSSSPQRANRANLVNPRIMRIMNVRGMGRREGRPHG